MLISTVDQLLKAKGIPAYRAAKELGVSDMFFSHLKKENHSPLSKNMDKLCEYFDCQPGDLVRYEKN